MPRTLKALLPAFLPAGSRSACHPRRRRIGPDRQGRISRPRRRLHRLSYRTRGQDLCRRPADETPFGTLYTSNITPIHNGIGMWTSDQFYQMMHNGRFPDGGLLSGDAVCLLHQGDARTATRSTLLALDPSVKQINRPHDLKFPFNNRSLILGWRTLFFNEGVYKPIRPNRRTGTGAYRDTQPPDRRRPRTGHGLLPRWPASLARRWQAHRLPVQRRRLRLRPAPSKRHTIVDSSRCKPANTSPAATSQGSESALRAARRSATTARPPHDHLEPSQAFSHDGLGSAGGAHDTLRTS